MHCNIFLEGNGPGRSKTKTIIHIKAGRVWKGPAVSRWVEVPACLSPLYILHLERDPFFGPLFPKQHLQLKKNRQVVRVDRSWMDFLCLSPSFSISQSPEASISLITESLHLNGRLCIVRTKGRAASEEVLDRGNGLGLGD